MPATRNYHFDMIQGSISTVSFGRIIFMPQTRSKKKLMFNFVIIFVYSTIILRKDSTLF